jgi:hypothetical protein
MLRAAMPQAYRLISSGLEVAEKQASQRSAEENALVKIIFGKKTENGATIDITIVRGKSRGTPQGLTR